LGKRVSDTRKGRSNIELSKRETVPAKRLKHASPPFPHSKRQVRNLGEQKTPLRVNFRFSNSPRGRLFMGSVFLVSGEEKSVILAVDRSPRGVKPLKRWETVKKNLELRGVATEP